MNLANSQISTPHVQYSSENMEYIHLGLGSIFLCLTALSIELHCYTLWSQVYQELTWKLNQEVYPAIF